MAAITSLEKGLSRLLKLCPDLTLDARQIQLIIDGNQNRVIAEHKGTWVEPTVSINEAPEIIYTQEVTEDVVDTSDNNKSFNEYFD